MQVLWANIRHWWKILNVCRMRKGKCRRVLGKGAGDWVVWGERRQPGEGRGAGNRDRRAAEPAGAELQSAVKPRCLRGQPWGPGLLIPQCWQTKSRKDRQVPAPGTNLPSSQLPAFSVFLGELSGWGGGGSLLASLLVWHLPRAGGYGWGGDELLVCPPQMPFLSTSLHTGGEN